MTLLDSDAAFLVNRGLAYEVTVEAGMLCVVLPAWQLPPAYDHETADLLVRLQAGYPDLPPDMWWFCPGIHFADGRLVPNTDVVEEHLGRTWQRWSRHLQPGQWQVGIDGLESYLALVAADLSRWTREAPQ